MFIKQGRYNLSGRVVMCLLVCVPIVFLTLITIVCGYWLFTLYCIVSVWALIELTFDTTIIVKDENKNNIKS